VLVLIDFCLLYRAAMDTLSWQRLYNRKKWEISEKEKINAAVDHKDQSATENQIYQEGESRDSPKEAEEKAKIEKEKAAKRKVDLKATYAEYFRENAKLELLSATLRLSKEVYNSPGCRLFELTCMARIAVYQFLVVSSQYASGLMIILLTCTELLKIKIVAEQFMKHRFLNSSLVLIAQISQSVFILLFLVLCFLYHFQSFKQYVTQGSQTFGTIVIFVAVIVEWVIAMIGLIVNLFIPLICKKKEKKPPAFEMIKYYDNEGLKLDNRIQPVTVEII